MMINPHSRMIMHHLSPHVVPLSLLNR
jgi:hypothetical protein